MNLFYIDKNLNGNELTDILVESENIRIEKIVSSGQISPKDFWYDQEQNEFVTLLQGEAVITYEDGNTKLKAGDNVVITAHKKHKVDYTSIEPPCVWLCVFYS